MVSLFTFTWCINDIKPEQNISNVYDNRNYRRIVRLTNFHTSGISEAKVKIMKIKINVQKQRSPGSIYTGTIKNTHLSTFGSYIKELLVQKYWQLIISISNNCGQYQIVLSKSRTVQYRVPRCSIQYRNVQVPRCLGFGYSAARNRSWH